jgi:Ca-activated chloride channel family protein
MVGDFIIWAQYHLLWLGLVSGVGVLLVIIWAVRMYRAVDTLAVSRYRQSMLRGFSYSWLLIRVSLVVMVFVALWIALLRPQYMTDAPQSRHEFTRDVVIAVDISRSMLVEDEVEPGDSSPEKISRLKRAQKFIDTLLHQVKLERIALVAFSGSALTLCPLTKDVGVLHMFVDLLSPDIISGGGTTSIEAAMDEAVKIFSQYEKHRQKLVVIITDGEDFSLHLAEAQKKAAEMGLHITMLGLGTSQGGPVPHYDAQGHKVGYQKDGAGSVVISRLNKQLLQTIANGFHGLYLDRSLSHGDALDKLLAWIRAREAYEISEQWGGGRADLFMWCIACALIILLITWI